MIFTRERTIRHAFIGNCGGIVAQQAEAKTKGDELHNQFLRNIVSGRRKTASDSSYFFARMVVESCGDRFAPENETLVLQQLPVNRVAARERVSVRQRHANAGAPQSFRITAGRRRSANNECDVQPTRHNTGD